MLITKRCLINVWGDCVTIEKPAEKAQVESLDAAPVSDGQVRGALHRQRNLLEEQIKRALECPVITVSEFAAMQARLAQLEDKLEK